MQSTARDTQSSSPSSGAPTSQLLLSAQLLGSSPHQLVNGPLVPVTGGSSPVHVKVPSVSRSCRPIHAGWHSVADGRMKVESMYSAIALELTVARWPPSPTQCDSAWEKESLSLLKTRL
eukprot:scaffold41422_cov63-Phaeocystis_antarctica.AAC.1